MYRQTIMILILAIACYLELKGQGWQSAAHISGALMEPNFIQSSEGQTLIPLRRVLANQKDTLLFFSVNSMLSTPEPWHLQAPVKIKNLHDVYDSDGKGRHDIIVTTYPFSVKLIFNVCTEQQLLLDSFPAGGSAPASSSLNRYKGDMDGDSVQDVLTSEYDEEFAKICFGDRENPYRDWSIVPATIYNASNPAPYIAAVGKLSGRHCMVQLVYKSPNSAYYQLMELDQSDVNARRDTIRTRLLHEIQSTDGKFYGMKILRADTVWHLFPDASLEERTELKVTIAGIGVEPSVSGISSGSWDFWFGHGKETGDRSFPVVMDAHRPFVAVSRQVDTLQRRVLHYYECSNTNQAEIRMLGEALLPLSITTPGNVGRAVLIPDQDGDDLEDIVVEHSWHDPQTEAEFYGVSAFFTSQRDQTSILGDRKTISFDTTNALNAFRTPAGWLARNAAQCAASSATGTVYNVLGEHLSIVNVEISGRDLVIRWNGLQNPTPMWCVVSGCVIKLM